MTEFPADTLAYPEPSKANTVLVLAIIGLVVLPIVTSPIAWIMGRNELRAIDEGRRSPEGQRVARIGMVIGMVTTILSVLGAAILILALRAFSA